MRLLLLLLDKELLLLVELVLCRRGFHRVARLGPLRLVAQRLNHQVEAAVRARCKEVVEALSTDSSIEQGVGRLSPSLLCRFKLLLLLY